MAHIPSLAVQHLKNDPDSTSVTLQSLEALERNSCGSCHKLQKSGSSLLIEGLHRLPEPPDDVAVCHTVLQPCVGLPVIQVYLIQSTYYQLGKGTRLGVTIKRPRHCPPPPSSKTPDTQEALTAQPLGCSQSHSYQQADTLNLECQFAVHQGRVTGSS